MAENRQIVVVVAAIFNEKGELFLIQRNNPGTNYNEVYALPGGKINFGETPVETVKREVQEETGFNVEVQELFPEVWSNILKANDNTAPDTQAILIAYRCKIIDGKFQPDGRETLAGGFYAQANLDLSKCMKPIKEVFELMEK